MKLKFIFLSCALLAILIAQLPTGEAVTCAAEPNNADCVDCLNPINVGDAECLADEEEEEEEITTELTTSSPGDNTQSTTRRTRPTRRASRRPNWGRPGWRRPGWRRRPTTTVRPRTILGSIMQKKIDFLNRMKQPRPRLMG